MARSVSGCNGVSGSEGLFLMHGVGIRSARSLALDAMHRLCVCVCELNLIHNLISLDRGHISFYAHEHVLDIHS